MEPQLKLRPVAELRAHPSLVRHNFSVPAHKLAALKELGEQIFREPISITKTGIVIDGNARLELARHQCRAELICFEHDFTDDKALVAILRKEASSRTLNAFARITLALDLSLSLQQQALANQRHGGKNKAQSKLTEADKIDVRSEIAHIAGVSTGNVTKVKQILATVVPEVRRELERGTLSIHRGYSLSKLSASDQRLEIKRLLAEKGVNKTIQILIAAHTSQQQSQLQKCRLVPETEQNNLLASVAAFTRTRSSVMVGVINVPGNCILLSQELVSSVSQCHLLPTDAS